MRGWPAYAALGTNLAMGTGIFVFGGYYLDGRFGTGVQYTAVGTGLAFLFGAYEVWKVLKELEQEDREQSERSGSAARRDADGDSRS